MQVVDALVVTLGIDSSKFTADQQKANDAVKKFGDQSEKTNKKAIDDTKKLGENFEKVKNAVIGLAAVVIGFNGLKDFVSAMVTGNAALGRTSTMLNMSARELDAWGHAVQSVGGTSEGFQQSLQNIEGGLQKFRMGMGGEEIVTALTRLGVQAKNGTVNLVDLSAALVRVKNAQGAQAAMALGQQLGLDQSTFQLLLQGPQAVQALYDKMYALSGVTEENTKAAQRLQAAWAGLKEASSGAGNTLFGTLTPALEWLAQKLTALSVWARENQTFVNGFFIGLAASIGLVVVATFPLVGAIAGITLAIGAASIAIGALYADWMHWTSGGKSALGDLWNYYSDVIKAIITLFTGSGRQISAAWGKVWTDCKAMFTDFVNWIKGSAPTIGDAIKNAFESAFNWVRGRARAVWDAITGKQSAGDADSPGSNSSSGGSASSSSSGGGSTGSSRGIRNNNPGNIEYGDFARKMGATGSDGRFAIFPSMQQGVAAMMSLIQGYKSKGIDTISGIISKYAPSSENNTGAYIADVVKQTGIGASQHLTDAQYASVQQAMARHESGYRGMVGAGVNASAQQSGGVASTVQTNIQSINVQTQATDANGIARDMHKALSNNSLISSGTYGVA
jgi:hypothetical protein